MRFDDPRWRRAPVRTALRVAASLLRRRVRSLAVAPVPFDGGRSRVEADLRTALGLRLYRYGIWDADLALVAVLLRPGDVFIDGGANVGLFSLVAAARVCPGGKVFAFEPSPATAASFTSNTQLNAFTGIELRQAALGSQSGTLRFAALPGDGAGTSRLSATEVAGARMIDVPVETLDALLPRLGPGRTMVKLDLEGAELEALRGAAGLLGERAPDLLIEVIDEQLARFGASVDQLTLLLDRAGYRFFETRLDERGPLLLDWGRRPGTAAHPNLLASTDPDRLRAAGLRIMNRE